MKIQETGFVRHTIHLIGNAHIDPAWLWRWTDGFSEVKATFRAALDRLAEYPDFIFTCAGACYYRWIEDNCPEMFEEIKRYVAAGRWIPVNGWWLQPDCNIPCGESFARHALYSQRFYLDRFGMICDTGYNVDSFGHNGMLPQLLAQSGMKYYVFMRPGDQEKANVPSLFWWESRDGSRVLTAKIRQSYTHADAASLPEKVDEFSAAAAGMDLDLMLFYGVGNHGGGPTIALLDKINDLQNQDAGKNLIFSSPPQYLRQMAAQDISLPVIRDDLQQHAIGCYSANLGMKQLNRRAEQRLLSAERIDALAHMVLQAPLHTADLAKAWEKVLFCQFHDILAGCCIKTVYDDARETVGYALCSAGEIQNGAAQRLSWAVDTLGSDRLPRSKEEDWCLWGLGRKGSPVVIFNPLPFPAARPVEVRGTFSSITDSEGNPMAVQRVRSLVTNGATDKWNTLFIAPLPALGYKTFWLHRETAGSDAPPAAPCPESEPLGLEITDDGKRLANSRIELFLDPGQGCLAEIRDRRSGQPYTDGPSSVALVIDETHSDTWGHGLKEYRDVIGRFTGESLTVTERGPVRAAVRLTARYQASTLIQDILIYADRPDIEIRLKINWQEKHKLLKLEFPVKADADQVTAEIPYGFIERKMDGTEQPMQQWADISGSRGGLALINNSSYGLDCQDRVLRQTILRSPIYADHFGVRDEACEFMEQGEHEVGFLLVPHGGGRRTADIPRKAAAFNMPPVVVYETYHQGPLPQQMTGLEIRPASVMAAVLKATEDGQGMILRCYETQGEAAEAAVTLPALNRSWTAAFGPNEIKTFLIPADLNEGITEVNLIER
ncbi:MAG: glycoside hydrolase family 38 C-terminal domain-containing protein [Clostridiaceae bacterium]|nr:glycoside hydrolase family 38 C-terminal domain-containing protein [Clostridiaceae bacterium]